MNQEKLKKIAMKNIDEDNEVNIKNYTISDITVNEETSNDKVTEYIGEVFFKDDDGEDVSSVFSITVLNNGNYEFTW